MHVGSTCAWMAQRDRTGCIRLIDRHITATILEMSVEYRSCFSTITFVCLVLYISLGSMIANLLQCMYIHCIYLMYMYL